MNKGTKTWGMLCPEGHGLLVTVKGTDKMYCPNNAHNGRPKTHPEGAAEPTPAFFDRAAVGEGYTMAKDLAQGTGLTAKQIKQMQAAAQADVDAAEAPADAPAAKAPRAARSRTPQPCADGCGGMTKGGKFLPGHDAKLHSRQKAEEKAKQEAQAATA